MRLRKKIGSIAYQLKLPPDSKVHPVFHASLLKKSIAPNVISQPLPPFIDEEWELQAQPEEVLNTCRSNSGEVDVLIKWKGLPEFENSWEPTDKLRENFPGFLLEGKESFERGGGVDRTPKVC